MDPTKEDCSSRFGKRVDPENLEKIQRKSREFKGIINKANNYNVFRNYKESIHYIITQTYSCTKRNVTAVLLIKLLYYFSWKGRRRGRVVKALDC